MQGERRVITILFCDVVGSTAMAEKLDPEEWAEIMDEAFHYLTEPVHRYEGRVARLMGDGILAFFGAPLAHEDDPQRAVLAGLDILSGIKPFTKKIQQEYGLDFNVRVGIGTGPVVVGEIGSDVAMEYTAMGDAVNLAARMEQTAQPGSIQVAESTFRLVAPIFDFEILSGIQVKGKSEPVRAYRILGRKAIPGRLRGIAGLESPLIGRFGKWKPLNDRWPTFAWAGRIITLIGEAGWGKAGIEEVKAMMNDDDDRRPTAVLPSSGRSSVVRIRLEDTGYPTASVLMDCSYSSCASRVKWTRMTHRRVPGRKIERMILPDDQKGEPSAAEYYPGAAPR
jgi:class 3 adenylate cyclase